VPLIKEIKAKGTPPDSSLLQGTFDTKAQAALCNAIAVDLGFSLEQGRLDVSVHPFPGGLCPPPLPPPPTLCMQWELAVNKVVQAFDMLLMQF